MSQLKFPKLNPQFVIEYRDLNRSQPRTRVLLSDRAIPQQCDQFRQDDFHVMDIVCLASLIKQLKGSN